MIHTGQQFRYAREVVGAFVLITLLLFVLALFNAERFQEWINPGATFKVVLPQAGLFGLAEGASIEILGTPAGAIRKIVIDPSQNIHAEAYITRSMIPFVRRDSKAFIRKRFGVAGESYLEINRGFGEELDWDFAVIQAQVERAPTETVGELLEEIRVRVFPIIDTATAAINSLAAVVADLQNPEGNLQTLLANLNTVTGKMARGEGSIGRLISNDTMALEVENLLTETTASVSRVAPLIDELQATAVQITGLSTSFNEQSGEIPELTRRATSLLASMDAVMRDWRKTTPELPKITRDVAAASSAMPVLMVQTQQTMLELEQLLRQLRKSWLFGGGGGQEQRPESSRIPPELVRP